MTDTTAPTGREFRIGPIFTRSWSIYAANFLMFTLVAVVAGLPNQLGGDFESGAGAARSVIAFIISVILYFVGQAVILYGAFQAMRGRDVMIGDAIGRAFSRFLSLLGISILVGFGVAIGFMLLVVPGIILALRWAVAVPACVVENKGPLESMRRSAELTKGHRWKIFGIWVLLAIVAIIILIIVGVLAGLAAVVAQGLGRVLIAAVISLILTAIVTAYSYVLNTVIYHDLRTVKEGVGTEEIAAVFD
jgi:Membrane domain of glycerophosphoryl diester phosphodiesterase